MSEPMLALSSMATKKLLAELSRVVPRAIANPVRVESAGGTEVAKRIRSGARADLAVLSATQLADLDADGWCRPGTLRPLFVSDVVAAVPAARNSVPLDSEHDLRAALTGADRIAYSTGPSGTAVVDLIRRWGLWELLRPRLVQAPPGTPVGSLLAGREADLGFQQRSEVSDLDGVRVLGPLPGAAAIRSTFSGAVLARSPHHASARAVLEFFGSRDARETVLAAGMALADRIDTGIVHINDQTVDDEAVAPFGGMADSGTGSRFGGSEANLEAFTETRWYTVQGAIADYPFRAD